jgi:hypothetical protein
MAVKIKEIAMLMMRDHGVRDYAELPHMDTTEVGVLREADRACLEELGQYLAGTGAWPRFGIWLLHKHFEPAAGEVFVERAIAEPRGTQTCPVSREARGELHTTAIRFDSAAEGVGVVGMEFAAAADFGDTAPLSDDDEAVLAGIGARLAGHGKTDRFGVRLIRDPLKITENELLQESSDSSNRTLDCVVGLRDEVLADRTAIQTAWRWTVRDGETAPIVVQDCTAACIRAGEGHDISHKHTEPDVYD